MGRFFRIGVMMCVLALFSMLLILEESANSDQKDSGQTSYETPLEDDTVGIGPHYVEMPVGRILLIRKDQSHAAVKFTKFWSESGKNDHYASYECWYRDNGPGSFLEENVRVKTGKASISLYGIGRFSFNMGNEEVRCGVFRLWWWGKGMVYFFGRAQEFRDYGLEFAPTGWTDIKQVNILDQSLVWYKYDKDRPRTDIPVSELLGK